jgi:cell division protein FtsI (penicillin-binding protein 3)
MPPKSCQRLVMLNLGVAFFFCLLLVQFYRIQIIEGEKWSKRAQAQHQIALVEPCKRGTFYSNAWIKEGHLDHPVAFVADVPKFHLYADALAIPEKVKEEVRIKLSELLGLTKKEQEGIKIHLEKASRSRKLSMWLELDKKALIENWWFPFAKKHRIARNALFFVKDFQRSYPYGKMLGQILHTIREQKDPKTHAHIPTGGLELALDSYLKGREGKRVIMRSPRNPLDLGQVLVEPQDGADVFLTINEYLQAISEEEIEKAVAQANAKSGWSIMMDPYTGEILSWAQFPSFQPACYQSYFNNPALQGESKVKGITDPFEPGSTFKPITMFVCFKANEELKKRGEPPLFSPHEKVSTSNGFFPGRKTPIRDTRLHKHLNMYMALQHSSNIYMAKMIQRVVDRLGDKWYRNCLAEVFGFGIKTGIELPSESTGVLPSPGKMHANGKLEWSKPTPYSLAFGHNILATSLQMVKAYALLANGGYSVKPTLIRKIVRKDREGKETVLLSNEGSWQETKKGPFLSEESLTEIRKGLMYVTKPGGSALKGDIFGFTEAGKTATSEKIINGTYSNKSHISSFIGWSPAKNPRFILMIVIDEPEAKYIPGVGKNQYGGNCAAPAFRVIGRKALEYLGVEEDDPYGFPVGDPRRDVKKAIWQQETKQLNDLYEQWNAS